MNVAIKFGALSSSPLVDPDGELVTETGQATIAQELLAMYPGSQLVGKERGHGKGFDIVRLGDIDPLNTLVINLDVLDSVGVFQRLHRSGAEPKIMNFQWINPSTYHHPVNFAAMGLSYVFFPTFCSGERTAAEVREVSHQWAIQSLVNRARIAWADLGIRVDQVPQRIETPEPIVLYPAISMAERKQPQQFIQIVTAVQKRTPIRVVARLAESHLVNTLAIRLATLRWSSVSPLRAQEDYWTDLARTTAFLATSVEEAYGSEYVEAMLAGAIGIFPNRPWVRGLVPEGYPFVYDTNAQAEQLLIRAVQEPDACRAELDRLVNGSFVDWVRSHHDRRGFEEAFKSQVAEWFGQ